MKVVIQRVNKASVSIDGEITAQIKKGLLIFVGIMKGDSDKVLHTLADKIIKMRVFENAKLKFDRSLRDVDGEILIISQFTLFADYSKGRRPFFGEAEESKKAKKLYEQFIAVLKELYNTEKVQAGVFAAYMQIESENDGPVTLILDSKNV